MFMVIGNSGHVAYGIKEYVCDTTADIDDLPIDIAIGSTAFVIEGSKVYMLNNQRKWVEV